MQVMKTSSVSLFFDSGRVNHFFNYYKPIRPNNFKISQAFSQLSNTATLYPNEHDQGRWSKNTEPPKEPDYTFAKEILTSVKKDDNYFSAKFNYLFFYNCLPENFQYKWTQEMSGYFQFNTTLFNSLRIKCKVFDNHIYGKIEHHDKNTDVIFKNFIINEFTIQEAKIIKECIVTEKQFQDKRFK